MACSSGWSRKPVEYFGTLLYVHCVLQKFYGGEINRGKGDLCAPPGPHPLTKEWSAHTHTHCTLSYTALLLHDNDSITGGCIKVNVIDPRSSSTNQLQALAGRNHLGSYLGSRPHNQSIIILKKKRTGYLSWKVKMKACGLQLAVLLNIFNRVVDFFSFINHV